MPNHKKPKCRVCDNILYVLGTHIQSTERKGWYCKECNAVYLNKGIIIRQDNLYIGLKKIT